MAPTQLQANTGRAPLRTLLFGATAVALLTVFLQALTGLAGGLPGVAIDHGLTFALELGGGIACLVRAALVRDRRLAWTLLGLGVLVYAGGDAVWGLAGEPRAHPWAADAAYVAFYPLTLGGMALLLADGRDRVAARLWIDGLIGGLTVGAIVVAFAYQPILRASAAGSAQTALSLSYPLADLVLVAFVLTAFATQAWRPGGVWVLLGLGIVIFTLADSLYAYQAANASFDDGSLVAALWPAALVCWGWAAWQPWRPRRIETGFGRQAFAVPALFAMVAVGLLCYGQFTRISTAAVVLATAALLVATLRAGWTFRENMRLLTATRHEALTDGLTGLANRRRLMVDLERAVADSRAGGRPRTLAFFDLDGFKGYNDGFGHAAGDMLLDRLARRLAAEVAGHGRAYRLGGDEFCVLLEGAVAADDPLIAACAGALAEQGEGFQVGASHGVVAIPEEGDSATHALQLADQRMYAAKDDSRTSSRRQTCDVLLQVLREREPDLHEHLHGVAALAVGVARGLGLAAEQLDELARAAELHDVGKIAIPDALLHKQGALDPAEWRLMREHTVIGDRILSAAPAMRPVARVVRSSHERWDGAGYPDGLAGEQIPLGARIVAVCDAYDAMTRERPFRARLSHDDALAELRRCAGSQFDPAVVEMFCALAAKRTRPSPAPVSS
jgi:two-component system cell cycle response regulator